MELEALVGGGHVLEQGLELGQGPAVDLFHLFVGHHVAAGIEIVEVAEQLSVHYMTAYRYVRLGILPARREGRSWRILAADLEAFTSRDDVCHIQLVVSDADLSEVKERFGGNLGFILRQPGRIVEVARDGEPVGSRRMIPLGGGEGETAPGSPDYVPALYDCLHEAMLKELVLACHDLSEGGLAVAAAEMCLAGRIGMTLNLDDDDTTLALFGESNGRFLAEVEPQNAVAFESCFTSGMAG